MSKKTETEKEKQLREEREETELLEWYGETQNLWDLEDCLKDNHEILARILKKNPNILLCLINRLATATVNALEFHSKDELEGQHENIRSDLSKLEARFRKHRHDFSKAFSEKPQY